MAERACGVGLCGRACGAHWNSEVEIEVTESVRGEGSCDVGSRVLVEDPDVDRQVFIAQNKEAQAGGGGGRGGWRERADLLLQHDLEIVPIACRLYFRAAEFPHGGEVEALGGDVGREDLLQLRKWDSSLESLKRLLYAIEVRERLEMVLLVLRRWQDDYERERHIVQFNDIMKVRPVLVDEAGLEEGKRMKVALSCED
eukprot:745652-Hanusia_phi.AAC.1